MPANHIRSYYAASANPAPDYPPLTGEIEADVCVIGGGMAGCSTALHLAERGYRVVLLEGHRIGWGASGRSGGQALAGFASGQQTLVKQVGAEAAHRMWDISVEALDLLRDLVERYSIECDLHWGTMLAALKPRQRAALLEEFDETRTVYGYEHLEFLEREQVEAILATKRYCAALLDRRSRHLHPLNYTLGLAAAARTHGVTIYEETGVKEIRPSDPARVITAHGSVRAKFVALCCNAYIGPLSSQLRARIMPVGTYIIATEPLGEERIRALMRENIAVSDVNFVLDYFRRSADHRLLFGGRVSYSGLNGIATERATRRRMLRVFPQLADVRTEYAWGGYVDITMNRAPDFGRLAPNVYYLQGFSGHGIALSTIAGKLIAEVVSGHAERFDLFTKLEHRNFPGGPLFRTPTLVLAMMWYRLKDLL
ncbi:MAG: FAD-binding oxidoreductase [Xanthomonadaceae bacterium]|nr:FAD-binding oxidoreductase [Xanthomonadaceae bacterium]